jgi:YbbR domain-containing protein
MQVTLAPAVTKTLDNVIIEYANNVKGYRFTLVDLADVVTAVQLYGTQTNVDVITSTSLYVYFDMKNVTLGEQEVQLYVEGPSNLVKYTLVKSTIRIKVTE